MNIAQARQQSATAQRAPKPLTLNRNRLREGSLLWKGGATMGHTSLRLGVQQISGAAALVTLEGAVTAEAEAALVEAMEHAAGRGARSLLFDLSRVPGIDSGGASALVKLWATAKRRGVRLFAAAPDAGIREILELTQLSEAVPVFDKPDLALSAMGVAAGSVPPGEVRTTEVTRDETLGTNRGSVVYWSKPVKKLRVTRMPGAVTGLTVAGRRPVGPVKGFGQMCGIAAALPGAIHLVLTYPEDLGTALSENVMAGGDSAARGMAVGMILGAALGFWPLASRGWQPREAQRNPV